MTTSKWILQFAVIMTLVGIQNMLWRHLQATHPDWVVTIATYVTAGAIGYIVNDVRQDLMKRKGN